MPIGSNRSSRRRGPVHLLLRSTWSTMYHVCDVPHNKQDTTPPRMVSRDGCVRGKNSSAERFFHFSNITERISARGKITAERTSAAEPSNGRLASRKSLGSPHMRNSISHPILHDFEGIRSHNPTELLRLAWSYIINDVLVKTTSLTGSFLSHEELNRPGTSWRNPTTATPPPSDESAIIFADWYGADIPP